MRRRKCLIGIVAFQGVQNKILENYIALAFHLGRRVPEIDFFLRVVGKKEQFRARNNLCDMAKFFLTEPDDILWMLDDDMVLPSFAFERLLHVLDTHPDAGVVGGLYWQRDGTYRPVIQKIMQVKDAYGVEWYAPHEIDGSIKQVGILGGGCLMIRMEALSTLMPPIFWIDGIVGTDIHFCTRLNQAGWNAYCDTGLELGHLADGEVIRYKNIPQHFRKYSQFAKYLEEAACEYLGMDRMELESYQLQNLYTLERIWETKSRDTWEDIAEAYREVGDAAVARNTYYATHSDTGIYGFGALYDLIDKGMIPRNGPCLDYGCGIGVAAEILSQNGFEVEAMDLKDSEVLKFLRWRVDPPRGDGAIIVRGVDKPLPDFQPHYSMVVLLDIIEHLPNPFEILEDLMLRVIPGGLLHSNFAVMDFKGKDEGVPQHLKRITVNQFEELLKKHGFATVGTFTYKKEKKDEYFEKDGVCGHDQQSGPTDALEHGRDYVRVYVGAETV